MKEINLQISIDEANLILEALGTMPFVQVYALIGKIQAQAGEQIQAAKPSAESGESALTAPTIEEQAG
jgi:hypothetical protein